VHEESEKISRHVFLRREMKGYSLLHKNRTIGVQGPLPWESKKVGREAARCSEFQLGVSAPLSFEPGGLVATSFCVLGLGPTLRRYRNQETQREVRLQALP